MVRMNGKIMTNEKMSETEIRRMASRWMPKGHDPENIRIVSDSGDFFKIEFNDVLVIEDVAYLIRHNAKEGRFGIEEDVKYWVKRAMELESGDRKVLKLAFHENFATTIGGIRFECFRSPLKEVRILDLVKGKQNFMQGYGARDAKGNLIRILDFICGKTLAAMIHGLAMDHETYFFEKLPSLLKNYLECVHAIGFLHDNGEKHGDVRRDHILIDRETGKWTWIDFDINYRHRENIYGYDLFGLGNVLLFLAGKGDVLLRGLKDSGNPALDRLEEGDLNMIFRPRVNNLKKIYAYVPDSLNHILLHFSRGANWFYETTGQLAEDVAEFMDREF